MWYDNTQLLSHKRLINFVIGNRGGGKTFNAKKWCISDFKKRGKKFIWVRRYKTELNKKKISKFFDDIRPLFPNDKLEVKGLKCYCNGKEFGEFIALSTSAYDKSVPYPDYNKIIYDEVMITEGVGKRYLTDEVTTLLELIETIFRMRDDCRVLMLSNMISVVNPYFLYWGIKPDLSKRFTVYEDICIEFFKDQDYINAKKNTRFGRLVSGTQYGDYAIENNSLVDNDTFIGDKTPKSEYMMSIKYNNYEYGYWIDYKEGLIYVNRQVDKTHHRRYTLTNDDHEPNLLLIKSLRDSRAIENVTYAFKHGLIRFSDMQVKNQFYEYIRLLMR